MAVATALYVRFRQLIDEFAKFAIIGIAGVFVTNAVYDLLNLHLGLGRQFVWGAPAAGRDVTRQEL